MSARPAEHPAADVLRVLAVSHSSGALEIRGTPGGTIYLHEGAITFAEAPGAPELPKPGAASRQDLAEAVQASVLEAGLILLTGPAAADDKPLFRPGRQHWTGITCRIDVETVLAEIGVQQRRFADLGVDPDAEVRLRPLPRGGSVMITADQWRLLARSPGPAAVRALAGAAGMPLTEAVNALAGLQPHGIVDVVPPPGAVHVPGPPVDAPPPTAPTPRPPAAEPPEPPAPPRSRTPVAAPPAPAGPAAPATPAVGTTASNVVPLRPAGRARGTHHQRPREVGERAEPGGARIVPTPLPGRERPAATAGRTPSSDRSSASDRTPSSDRSGPAQAAATSRPGPSVPAPAPASALPEPPRILPRRSPGAVPIPASVTEPRRESTDGRTALAIRLLEGLRRM